MSLLRHAVADLTYAPASPTPGSPVVLTCSIGPPANDDPTPTGTVEFLDSNGNALGGAPVPINPCTNPVACASYSVSLPDGSYTFSVNYSGDSNYQSASPAADVAFTVSG
jgi:Bacterial Ig-like domain (group 3)